MITLLTAFTKTENIPNNIPKIIAKLLYWIASGCTGVPNKVAEDSTVPVKYLDTPLRSLQVRKCPDLFLVLCMRIKYSTLNNDLNEEKFNHLVIILKMVSTAGPKISPSSLKSQFPEASNFQLTLVLVG